MLCRLPRPSLLPSGSGLLLLLAAALSTAARAGQPVDPFADRPATYAREGVVPVRYVNLPPLLRSLDGAVAGRVGPTLVVAGGVDDTTVVYLEFQTGALLRLDEWQLVPGLRGSAWSAAAQEPESLIVVGGLVEGRPSAAVRRWRWEDRQLVEERLPDLPNSLWAAGAVVLDGRLYVLGGFAGTPAGAPERAVWTLDLRAADAAWENALELPQGLAHPLVAAQAGVLAVLGGVQADAPSPTGFAWNQDLQLHTPGSTPTWRLGTPAPEAIAHAAVLPVGAQTISVVHGGRMDRPGPGAQAEPLEALLLYNVITDRWYREAEPGQIAHAKSVLVSDTWWIIGNPPRARPPPAVEAQRAKLEGPLTRFGWWDRGALALYFLLVLALGLGLTRLTPPSGEYALGGRNLPGWAAGLGMFATSVGGLALLVFPALVFADNLSVWLPVLACLAAFFVQARWLYPLLRRLEVATVFEYLERRFNPHLRLVGAGQFLALQWGGLFALSLYLPAQALAVVTGLPPLALVLAAGLIALLVGALGGFRATAWTGAVQGMLILGAAAALLYAALRVLPSGPAEALAQAAAGGKLSLRSADAAWTAPALGAGLLALFLQLTFVQLGNQAVLQRVLGARPESVRAAAGTHNLALFMFFTLAAAAGLALFAFYRVQPGALFPSLPTADHLVPYFLNVAAPPGLAGLMVAGVLAGAMATATAAVNSGAVVVMEDCYRRFLRETKEEELLSVLRKAAWGGGALGLALAVVLCLTGAEPALRLWAALLGGVGGGLFGVFALGIFTRRASGAGAGAGAVAGVVVIALLELLAPGKVGAAWFLPLGVGACVGFGYALSVIAGTPARDLKGLTIYD